MKVGYLEKVLRAGVGTVLFVDSELGNEPSSPRVHLQPPIQNRFRFSTMLWDNENELEDVGEGIVFDELFGVISPRVERGTMSEQTSKTGRNVESNGDLSKPTTNINEEIIEANAFTQDNPSPVREKADVDLLISTEQNMSWSDIKEGGKEVKEDRGEAQDIANRNDIKKLKLTKIQSKESDRIPTVEIVKQDAIPVARSNQSSGPEPLVKTIEIVQKPTSRQNLNTHFFTESSRKNVTQMVRETKQRRESPGQLQPQPRKTSIAQPQKERIRIPLDIAKQENVHKSEGLAKAVGVIQKPTSQQNLNNRLLTESLKKSETQMAKITKDVELINNKLEEHIRKGHFESDKPTFLPKRPPSRNLGGWSYFRRSYIR